MMGSGMSDLYEKVLVRLLKEFKKADAKLIKRGYMVVNEEGFEYEVADIDDSDPENVLYVLKRAGWKSEPITHKDLKSQFKPV
jgi:hypothetical protein